SHGALPPAARWVADQPCFGTPGGGRIPLYFRGPQGVLPLGEARSLVVGRTSGDAFDSVEQGFLVDLSGPIQIVVRLETAMRAANSVQARLDAIAEPLPHTLVFIDDTITWRARAASAPNGAKGSR